MAAEPSAFPSPKAYTHLAMAPLRRAAFSLVTALLARTGAADNAARNRIAAANELGDRIQRGWRALAAEAEGDATVRAHP
jgi:hypothetical protein